MPDITEPYALIHQRLADMETQESSLRVQLREMKARVDEIHEQRLRLGVVLKAQIEADKKD